jgi:hypothetical protein
MIHNFFLKTRILFVKMIPNSTFFQERAAEIISTCKRRPINLSDEFDKINQPISQTQMK